MRLDAVLFFSLDCGSADSKEGRGPDPISQIIRNGVPELYHCANCWKDVSLKIEYFDVYEDIEYTPSTAGEYKLFDVGVQERKRKLWCIGKYSLQCEFEFCSVMQKASSVAPLTHLL